MNELPAKIILSHLYRLGCPTYRDSSGSLSRGGCECCNFCEANLELHEAHAADCLWREVERIATEAS